MHRRQKRPGQAGRRKSVEGLQSELRNHKRAARSSWPSR
jgi:hypothetical protein